MLFARALARWRRWTRLPMPVVYLGDPGCHCLRWGKTRCPAHSGLASWLDIPRRTQLDEPAAR